jgi:hypothetical protein
MSAILDVTLRPESTGRISAWLGEERLCGGSHHVQLDAARTLASLGTPLGAVVHFRLADNRLVRATTIAHLLAQAGNGVDPIRRPHEMHRAAEMRR